MEDEVPKVLATSGNSEDLLGLSAETLLAVVYEGCLIEHSSVLCSCVAYDKMLQISWIRWSLAAAAED